MNPAFFWFTAQYDILGHGKRRYEHKVLMYHAYPSSYGLHRLEAFYLFSSYIYASAGGPVESVQDVHESALACAVFSHKGKDFSLFYLQRYMVVGDHLWKFH